MYPIRTNNYAGTEALQRLFALSLRSASAEKLPQRIIRKRKCRLSARDRLCGKYRHNTGRDLLHDGREGRDNSLACLLRLLRHYKRQTGVHAQHGQCEQRARP